MFTFLDERKNDTQIFFLDLRELWNKCKILSKNQMQ